MDLHFIPVENIIATHSKYLEITERGEDPYKELLIVQSPLGNFTEPIPIWIVACAKCINISATFIWNYTDVFITTISLGLSTQFQIFNAEVDRAKDKVRPI